MTNPSFPFHWSSQGRPALGHVVALVAGFLFVCVVNGALPFYGIPTLTQAVGTTIGWAQAFINEGWFAIYSRNFGYPEPAARSFGLAGVVVAGIYMRLGFHGADAYAMMVATWLALAYLSAFRLATALGVGAYVSVFAAVLWLSLPVVVVHGSYSMLSLGIALLPFYFLAFFCLVRGAASGLGSVPAPAFVFILSCFISVFMDGYTFMMFATGSGLLVAWFLTREKEFHRQTLFTVVPVFIVGFSLAYFAYTSYIGRSGYGASSLEFFRGWGMDLVFAFAPSQGVMWFWDWIGLSVGRSSNDYFGDSSVWRTTFVLPLLVAGGVGWWVARKRRIGMQGAFLLVALVGFYLAMGPSIKIGSTKPVSMGQGMPAELAIAPSGTAFLFENVPGFKNMRAVYRWSALSMFFFWILVLLLLASRKGDRSIASWVVVLSLLALYLPNVDSKLTSYANSRSYFLEIDRVLLPILEDEIEEGEVVAFLPYQNDLLLNYLSSSMGIRAYNVGGDKNLRIAREYWPEILLEFPMGRVDPLFAERVVKFLSKDLADVVVLPYMDTFSVGSFRRELLSHSEDLRAQSDRLARISGVEVRNTEYFSFVRMGEYRVCFGDPSASSKGLGERGPENVRKCIFELGDPVGLYAGELGGFFLGDGWSWPETSHRWTEGAYVRLRLPFGVVEDRPISVRFNLLAFLGDRVPSQEVKVFVGGRHVRTWDVGSGWEWYEVEISPRAGAQGVVDLLFEVGEPMAPCEVSESGDCRRLGLAAQEMLVQYAQ